MSFFGFGKQQTEDNEIPLSSPNHDNEQQSSVVLDAQSAPPAPVTSPIGPPPTKVNFMPSPALSSPIRATPNIAADPAVANIEIPNIHVQQYYEQPGNGIDENDHQEELAEEYQENDDDNDDAVQSKPSIDSYGTAGEGSYVEENGGYYDQNYHQQQQQHQHQQENGYNNNDYYYSYGTEDANNNIINNDDDNNNHMEPQASYDDELQEFTTVYTHASSGSMGSGEEPQPVLSQEKEEAAYQSYDSEEQYPQPPEPVETPYHDRPFHVSGTPTRETIDGNWSTVQPMPQTTTPSVVRRNILQRLRTPENRPEQNMTEKSEPKTAGEAIFTPEFKQIHQKNVRRRLNAQRNRQELERRLAKITNKLVNLSMDREAQQSHFIRDHVCAPMQSAVERVALEKTYLSSPQHNGDRHWMALTNRLSRLETEITQHIHTDMQDLMREKIDRLQDELVNEDIPQNHVDTYRSEKREGSLLHEFESHAGRCRRRYHEERAVRCGALDVVRQQLLTVAKLETDPARIEEATVKVKALRAKLEQERAERRMQDENLLRAIQEEEMNMKRALFQATEVDVMPSSDNVRRAIEY